MVKVNTCVFISGKGSNLNNLILRSRDYNFPIKIRLVICNNKNAYGIYYAKKNAIPILIIDTNKRFFENKIIFFLLKYKISLICLAGYMKIISKNFFQRYKKKIINIHPSLLPKFKGLKTFTRVIENNEKKTGCTVHFVNNKLDDGNIITKKIFYLKTNDNELTLKQKTQKLEYRAYPEAIIKIFRNC